MIRSKLDIGVTLGDPSGIGPEIVCKALLSLSAERLSRVILFGDKSFLADVHSDHSHSRFQNLRTGFAGTLRPADVVPGKPDDATGCAQVEYLEAAVDSARAGEIAGLVTAPISKAAAQAAGFAFPGHTEFLANRLEADRVAMMLAGPTIRVVLATVHEALSNLSRVLTEESIRSAIRLAARSLREDFGIRRPRIGVLALNPHAGEGGRFGEEEIRVITPAMQSAQEELGTEADLIGPLVPDAAFRMPFDCFVAMYHDQGLIPVKLIDFDKAVNMTLGLPIVRTSPDHGVAYDIAGTSSAQATSMSAAIELAFELVDKRHALKLSGAARLPNRRA